MDLPQLLTRTLNGMGYELVDLELQRGLMRVFIDKPDGISVEDCANVSNHLTKLFAVEEIDFDRLEVSSPGLDRPLTRVTDFERFIGQLAKVKLVGMVNGRKKFIGRIEEAGAEKVRFTIVEEGKDGAEMNLALADIDRARLVPDI